MTSASTDPTQRAIDAIDGALDDWKVSGDAMRWVPPEDRSQVFAEAEDAEEAYIVTLFADLGWRPRRDRPRLITRLLRAIDFRGRPNPERSPHDETDQATSFPRAELRDLPPGWAEESPLGAVCFQAELNGPALDGSAFPRAELRDLSDPRAAALARTGWGKTSRLLEPAGWDPRTGVHEFHGKITIVRPPSRWPYLARRASPRPYLLLAGYIAGAARYRRSTWFTRLRRATAQARSLLCGPRPDRSPRDGAAR